MDDPRVIKGDNGRDLYASPKNNSTIKYAFKKLNLIKSSVDSSIATLHSTFKLKDIYILGEHKNDDLAYITEGYKNTMLTPDKFIELEARLVKHYIKQGYLLPFVKIIESNKRNKGILKLEIKLASFERVVFEGDGQESKLIQQYAEKIVAQKPALIATTQRYLSLISKVAGYKEVTYKLNEKGDKADLILGLTKHKSSNYIGLDNYGIKDYGRYQTALISQWFSLLGRDEIITLNAATTNRPNRLSNVGVSYSQLVNSEGTSAYIAYSYTADNSTKGENISAPSNYGSTIRANLSHELLLTTKKAVSIKVGVTHKDSKAYAMNNNIPRVNTKSKYWVGDIGLKFALHDNYGGVNLANIKYLKGLGGNHDNYYAANNVNQHFQLYKFDVAREQRFINDFSMVGRFSAGYAHSVLPGAYKLSIGGRDFGRGYDFGAISGSSMMGLSLETRYTKSLDTKYIKHAQPYVFYDVGYIGKKRSEASVTTLQSAGLGLRFRMQHDVDLGVEMAAPTKRSYAVNGDMMKARTKLNLFINKVVNF